MVRIGKTRQLSRVELMVIMYAGAAASLMILLVLVKLGGWWLALSPLAWVAAAYLGLRGSELLHARADE